MLTPKKFFKLKTRNLSSAYYWYCTSLVRCARINSFNFIVPQIRTNLGKYICSSLAQSVHSDNIMTAFKHMLKMPLKMLLFTCSFNIAYLLLFWCL